MKIEFTFNGGTSLKLSPTNAEETQLLELAFNGKEVVRIGRNGKDIALIMGVTQGPPSKDPIDSSFAIVYCTNCGTHHSEGTACLGLGRQKA